MAENKAPYQEFILKGEAHFMARDVEEALRLLGEHFMARSKKEKVVLFLPPTDISVLSDDVEEYWEKVVSDANRQELKAGKLYKLESDSLNITLCEKKKTLETDKEALKFLVDLKVRETELKDLEVVVKKQDELYKLIGQLKV